MDPITAEILRIGISESAKLIFQKVLSKNWMKEYTGGRSIVEQLLSLDIQSDYIVKHISRAMKMRTIHSSENDVMLGNDSNLLIVFYVQIMPDDFVMQLHRF